MKKLKIKRLKQLEKAGLELEGNEFIYDGDDFDCGEWTEALLRYMGKGLKPDELTRNIVRSYGIKPTTVKQTRKRLIDEFSAVGYVFPDWIRMGYVGTQLKQVRDFAEKTHAKTGKEQFEINLERALQSGEIGVGDYGFAEDRDSELDINHDPDIAYEKRTKRLGLGIPDPTLPFKEKENILLKPSKHTTKKLDKQAQIDLQWYRKSKRARAEGREVAFWSGLTKGQRVMIRRVERLKLKELIKEDSKR